MHAHARLFFSVVQIGVQTDKYTVMEAGWYFSFFDACLLGVYLLESALKLFVFRLAFFDSSWNIFDLFIVVTSLFEVLFTLLIGAFSTGFDLKTFRILRVFRTLRALRSLRALRTISFFQKLQIILSALVKSIPAMASISFFLCNDRLSVCV